MIVEETSAQSVLLIEDNPGDARLIEEMLREDPATPFRLSRADRLSRGLELLSLKETELVLLDLSLPDSHGLETFSKVYAHSPKVPIIVLSGNDDQTLALFAVKSGAQDYLVKGKIDRELLLRAMQYSIERKRYQEELPVDLALDEIVLRAALHREERERLVVVAREHDDRHLGRVRVHLREGLEALAVRQRQVQEHELGGLERQHLEPARQPVGAGEPERRGGIFPQHLLDEAGVRRVVLDEEDRLRGGLLESCPRGGQPPRDHRVGRVAMVSQKRSMD